MQLEKSSPALSHTMRQNMALLQEAESDLVAKINNWFDQTMNRTSQRFTASTRVVTFAASFIVAFGLQVDTPNLVNRLAAADKLREALVAEAQALQADENRRRAEEEAAKVKAAADAAAGADAAAATPAVPAPAAAASTDPTSPEMISQRYNAFLAANGIIKLPSAGGWTQSFWKANPLGLLITALLLSLGAPFWYGVLGKLLQLRSAHREKGGRAPGGTAINADAGGHDLHHPRERGTVTSTRTRPLIQKLQSIQKIRHECGPLPPL